MYIRCFVDVTFYLTKKRMLENDDDLQNLKEIKKQMHTHIYVYLLFWFIICKKNHPKNIIFILQLNEYI